MPVQPSGAPETKPVTSLSAASEVQQAAYKNHLEGFISTRGGEALSTLEAQKELLGLEIKNADGKATTVLIEAVKADNLPMVRRIIELLPEDERLRVLDARDSDQWRALAYAMQHSPEIAAALLDAGASPMALNFREESVLQLFALRPMPIEEKNFLNALKTATQRHGLMNPDLANIVETPEALQFMRRELGLKIPSGDYTVDEARTGRVLKALNKEAGEALSGIRERLKEEHDQRDVIAGVEQVLRGERMMRILTEYAEAGVDFGIEADNVSRAIKVFGHQATNFRRENGLSVSTPPESPGVVAEECLKRLDADYETRRASSLTEIAALLRAGKDPQRDARRSVNESDRSGATLLAQAMKNRDWDTAALLLSNGARVRYIDRPGNSAYHYAARYADEKFLASPLTKMLQEHPERERLLTEQIEHPQGYGSVRPEECIASVPALKYFLAIKPGMIPGLRSDAMEYILKHSKPKERMEIVNYLQEHCAEAMRDMKQSNVRCMTQALINTSADDRGKYASVGDECRVLDYALQRGVAHFQEKREARDISDRLEGLLQLRTASQYAITSALDRNDARPLDLLEKRLSVLSREDREKVMELNDDTMQSIIVNHMLRHGNPETMHRLTEMGLKMKNISPFLNTLQDRARQEGTEEHKVLSTMAALKSAGPLLCTKWRRFEDTPLLPVIHSIDKGDAVAVKRYAQLGMVYPEGAMPDDWSHKTLAEYAKWKLNWKPNRVPADAQEAEKFKRQDTIINTLEEYEQRRRKVSRAFEMSDAGNDAFALSAPQTPPAAPVSKAAARLG